MILCSLHLAVTATVAVAGNSGTAGNFVRRAGSVTPKALLPVSDLCIYKPSIANCPSLINYINKAFYKLKCILFQLITIKVITNCKKGNNVIIYAHVHIYVY